MNKQLLEVLWVISEQLTINTPTHDRLAVLKLNLYWGGYGYTLLEIFNEQRTPRDTLGNEIKIQMPRL